MLNWDRLSFAAIEFDSRREAAFSFSLTLFLETPITAAKIFLLFMEVNGFRFATTNALVAMNF